MTNPGDETRSVGADPDAGATPPFAPQVNAAVAAGEAHVHDAGAAVAGWAHEAAEPARLELGEEDRLPWLESVSDDDAYEQVDGRRVAGVVIGGLIVLAGIVGAVWWGTHRPSGNTPAADGSLVAAPATPYKEAPANPGGKTFAGTGDTSFTISQGKTVQEHLAGAGDASAHAAGGVAASAAEVASEAAGATFAGKPGTTGGPGAGAAAPKPVAAGGDAAWSGGVAQIGAYAAEARAVAAWDNLARGHDVLTGVRHRVVSAVIDGGTVWRLQVLTPAGDAGAMCEKLKAAGLACQVKR